MNRSEILGLVYDAIVHRPRTAGVNYYLCFVKNKIQCLPVGNTPVPEILFRTYSTKELNEGFTSAHWGLIEGRIYTILKEKGLCKIP